MYDLHFYLPRDKDNVTGFGEKVYGDCTLIKGDIGDTKAKTLNRIWRDEFSSAKFCICK